MKFLLIFLMCALANGKILLQSRHAKGDGNVFTGIFFNGLMFFSASLVFLPVLIQQGARRETVVHAVIMGVLSVCFQLFYILAFSSGKTAQTSIIISFSMLIPMFVCLTVLRESFHTVNWIGAALALFSFCLTASKEERKGNKNNNWFRWIVLTGAAFLCSGLISVNQKFYSVWTPKLEAMSFVSIAYLTATFLSLILFLIGNFRNGGKIPMDLKSAVSGVLAGFVLGIFQWVSTYAASVISGSVLYPVYNCGSSVLLSVISVLFLKETLTKKQYAGLGVGIAAMALLNV